MNLTKRQKRIRDRYTRLIQISPRRFNLEIIVGKQAFPIFPRTWPKRDGEWMRDQLAIGLAKIK